MRKRWKLLIQLTYDGSFVKHLNFLGEFCECKDFEYRSPVGGFVHLIAATLARAKTFCREGCGERFPTPSIESRFPKAT